MLPFYAVLYADNDNIVAGFVNKEDAEEFVQGTDYRVVNAAIDTSLIEYDWDNDEDE